MKVAIYIRVSTTEQTTQNQLNPLIQYADRMGWEYEVFSEVESSRKTRPIQWELYNQLLKKEYDGLLIYKFDRWARSTRELVEHMERLIEKGVAVYSYTENIDLSNSMGRAMLTIISAFAQLERDLIRERTLAGLARARAQGKKLGRPRRGKEKPKPPINKVEELFLKGLSFREIAKELGTTKYWVEWSIKEMKNKPEKLDGRFREGVLTKD